MAAAVLIGLVGGLALASVAGARRTDSAFHRFLRAGNPSDLSIDSGSYDPALIRTFSQFPQVVGARTYVALDVAPLLADGRGDFVTYGNVETVGSLDGLFFGQDRFAVTQGRMASGDRADEVMVSETTARTKRLHVGQSLEMGVYSDDQAQDPGIATGRITPHFTVHTTVVGVGVFNDEVVQDETDRQPRMVLTPAFTARALRYATYSWTGLRLRRGAADVVAVKGRYLGALPAGLPHFFRDTAVTEAQAQRAIRPEATALGLFGLIAGLGGLIIGGQAVSRSVRRDRDDLAGLRALGASPTTTGSAGLLGAAVVIGAGVTLAVATAVALSPLAPIGAVRRVEVARGVSLDWTVLLVGSAGLFIVLSATAVLVSARQAPHRVAARSMASDPRSSVVAGTLSASGASPAAVVGARMALEAGSGTTATPVRSVIAGAIVAVVTLAASLTFGNSLHALVAHPSLYGWNFDVALFANGGYGNLDPAHLHSTLNRGPDVAAWSGYYFGSAELDGLNVPILGGTPGDKVAPPVLSGRGLAASDELVVGAATLAKLHRHVGDHVELSTDGGRQKLRIVGTASLPTIGDVHGTHPSLGSGALIASDRIPGFARIQNAHGGGPNAVFVRFRPGRSAAATRALTAAFTSSDPTATVDVLGVQRPAEIVNYRAMGSAPAAMGAALATAAIMSLGLALLASVRRRRRDLAIMKVLGFSTSQLAAAVMWQATITAVIGLVVGIPLGVAAGRALWTRFALQLHVVTRPSVPVLELIAVIVGGVLLANLVAAWPGLIAGRTSTAATLRSE